MKSYVNKVENEKKNGIFSKTTFSLEEESHFKILVHPAYRPYIKELCG